MTKAPEYQKDSEKKIHIGFDIGSISVNTIIMDENGDILSERYDYCNGKPFHHLREILDEIVSEQDYDRIISLSFTGTGGRLAAELTGGQYVNEIIAQSESVGRLYPSVRTVIEMGGEDSKLIFMDPAGNQHSQLSDFELNSICAAGTGSFLDQQARRIGVSIEKEFGELAMKSVNPPRIAGRCSVFAKSDMIHMQQVATPVHDIVAGLCFAVARNFISTVGRGKKIEFPVIFQGGVAANSGMVRAFRELLNARDGDLIVPDHHASMGAIGAVYHTINYNQPLIYRFTGTRQLTEYLEKQKDAGASLAPINIPDTLFDKQVTPLPEGNGLTDVSLGLDVGSLSTNVVLIDKDNRVIARRYLPTASKPLDAIRTGMSEVFAEVGDRVRVIAAGTTGSGRYLTGDFVGADVIRNEITAQATAAIAYDPAVDTIFEIGGQDSKYISIDNGIVIDFEMNKVCAAGTGSFLEEQAEKLDISIIKEFEELAFTAKRPPALGDRCTVFMESDLNAQQQKGTSKEDLIAGLAYSIVQNYIQKVVRKKRIGNHILFQGGVTNNRAVVSAFELVTGKKIYIPPHFDVTGAIGAAILARKYVTENNLTTRFKGYDISKIPYKLDRFTCKECSNQCEIRRVKIAGENKPLYYGGRCEKYELDERKGKGTGIPDYFTERLQMLMGDFDNDRKTSLTTIGIPRGLMIFYQQFPFWRTFFEELGFQVVLSDESNDQLIKKALDTLVAETCYPVEVMQGHIRNLFDKNVDYIFTPFIINSKAEPDNPTNNCNCPWIQTYPFIAKASLSDDELKRMLYPALNFRYFGKVLDKELSDFMFQTFRIPRSRVVKAIRLADQRQSEFENRILLKGQEVLDNLPADKECLVIMGRPYNTGDPSLNLSMVDKLINMDVVPIPMDFLPLGSEHITKDYSQMYWPNGQKILAATRIITRDDRLHAVYMSNFRCGPDSFLAHFVHEEMRGKPYLEIEIDEHSADAGMITRYEAFLDSLKDSKNLISKKEHIFMPGIMRPSPMEGRTLYFPYMYDGAYAIAAASRSCGMDADVLPITDKAALELGRKYTSSRECFPMICTTGSFLKKILEPGSDPKKLSFFMPDHNGPCRFGQYNRFQRIVFDKLGYKDVKIISPSNDNAYADISGGKGTKFRFTAWKGFVATDLLRKMKQERQPYEINPGDVEKVYQDALQAVIRSVETGAKDLTHVMESILQKFKMIPLRDGPRKPVIAIVGEIFMRDNSFCNGHVLERLERYGAETYIAPFSEWLTYSTYRYTRDSKWKGNYRGILKSKIQEYSQTLSANRLHKVAHGYFDESKDVQIEEMLEMCGPYIHRHYDGDPALNLGNSAALFKQGISGIANILPFTCMPGTVVSAVSDKFKRDHDNIPYINIAYDGQEDTAIDMRLQAFMHQAREFASRKNLNTPLKWS
jgi:predicted CoA-substrate-specific enzyme activase